MNIDFQERQKTALEYHQAVNPVMFWIKISGFGVFAFVVFLLVLYFESGNTRTFQINQAAADTGTILISLSMLLTTLSYFFNVFDRLIIYRKHLGVIGFAYIVAHIIFVMLMMPLRYPLTDWLTIRLLPFTFGAIATAIFCFMTLISNKYSVTVLGGVIWRSVLRYGGYTALLLSLIHIWLASGKYWSMTTITPSLFVFIVGVVAITGRVMMGIMMYAKKA